VLIFHLKSPQAHNTGFTFLIVYNLSNYDLKFEFMAWCLGLGFYLATLNAGRSSQEKALCPFVCLSVCQKCIVTKRKICLDFYVIGKII